MTGTVRDAPPTADVPGPPPDASAGTAVPPGRPRRRGVWIALAIATTLVLVAPACVQVWGRAIRQSAEGAKVYRHPISEVRLSMGSATLAVGPGQDGQVTVHERLHWALTRPEVRVVREGDVLKVDVSCDGGAPAVFSSLECGADLDLRVPAGVRIRAVAGAGEVRVRGLSGDLDLRVGAGQVTLAGLRGRVRVRAGSGTVRGTGLATPELTGRVRSGGMRLGFAEPPRALTLNSGSGEVRVGVPPGSYYRVLAGSGSGGTHVNGALVDQDAPARISVRTGSGSAWVDYANAG